MPRDLDVILIFAVLTTGAVLIIIQLGRLWRAGMLHKTIREAISRDNRRRDRAGRRGRGRAEAGRRQ